MPTERPSRPRRISPKSRRLRQSILTVGATWLIGAVAVAMSGMTTHPKPADLILVLGNAVDRMNNPLPSLAARLEAATALYGQGGYNAIMVSGGVNPSDGRNEALGMRDWLVAHGIPADRIVVDQAGDNTRASADQAYRWLSSRNLRSAVVVSQYFHLPRARLALRQAGIEDSGGAYPRRWFARDVYSTFREVPGYLAYWTGWR